MTNDAKLAIQQVPNQPINGLLNSRTKKPTTTSSFIFDWLQQFYRDLLLSWTSSLVFGCSDLNQICTVTGVMTGSKRSHAEAYFNAFLRGSINGLSPFYGSNPAFVFHLCLHAFTIRNLKLNRPAQSHLIEHLTLSRSQKCSHNFPYRLIYMRSCECTWERDKVSAMMHWS